MTGVDRILVISLCVSVGVLVAIGMYGTAAFLFSVLIWVLCENILANK